MEKAGTITSVELAKLCGVSQGTVDRALNNRAGISPKTKDKILKTARQYGYIKNMNASFLASGKTKLLGLVVFNFNNEFFAQLTAAIERKASEFGYSLLINFLSTSFIEDELMYGGFITNTSYLVLNILFCSINLFTSLVI